MILFEDMRSNKSIASFLIIGFVVISTGVWTTPLYGNNKLIIKGAYYIEHTIKDITFICDSTSKIFVTGKNIVIENCIFDANGYSVERSLIELIGDEVAMKGCTVKNIKGKDGKGAYGIYVDIERCSASIISCVFKNISDSREETDPVGQMKGMCGAILYSCSGYYLKTPPHSQIVKDINIENVFTSLPNGTINNKSFDADGIRIFINDNKSPQTLLSAQEYEFSGIKGRNIQKRLIKLSGATNCVISNVVYKRNKKISRQYPSHLIAVYDSENVQITDVDYSSGCNDIAFCGSNSKHVGVESIKVKDNSGWFRKSTSSLFRIFNCEDLKINGLQFSGQYFRLGQLSNSNDIEIQMDGTKVSCVSPFDIKDTKNLTITGEVDIEKQKHPIFHLTNVGEISVDGGLDNLLNTELFKLENCDSIFVRRKDHDN